MRGPRKNLQNREMFEKCLNFLENPKNYGEYAKNSDTRVFVCVFLRGTALVISPVAVREATATYDGR